MSILTRPAFVPQPNAVRHNDWRQLSVAPLKAFVPTLPVSVIIPYYRTQVETLARTLAGLERQTYPRSLFEVVVVDDGSEPPLQLPATALSTKLVRQRRSGFGLARARNAGARAACHGIFLFLDSDILVEDDWMASHARWHHAASDAVTMGAYADVAIDDIPASTIRQHSGSLRELFAERPADQRLHEDQLIRTNQLTLPTDDPFSVMLGGNFGFGRDFYWSIGGHDESFVRWGMEELELGYRATVGGALMVPVGEAFAWHQGRTDKATRKVNNRNLRLQRAKAAHLIAFEGVRDDAPGRFFAVPKHVVTIAAESGSTDDIVKTVFGILADRIHDLVVRIEVCRDEVGDGEGDEELDVWLEEMFQPDPRVHIASQSSALDDFPASPFHITLSEPLVAKDLVFRLRQKLGDAVLATVTSADGASISIARAWALNRARRTGKSLDQFGETKTFSGNALKLGKTSASMRSSGFNPIEPVGYPTKWQRLFIRARYVHGLRDFWFFLKWLAVLGRNAAKVRWLGSATLAGQAGARRRAAK